MALWMSSCEVDEFDITTTEKEPYTPSVVYVNDIMAKAKPIQHNDGLKVECITVKYPFQLQDDKGQKLSINTNPEFEKAVNDTSILIVDFVYPLYIIDNIGLELTVSSLWDFAKYAAGCYPDSLIITSHQFPAYVINDVNSCYNLKYPLVLQKTDGTQVTVVDERTFIQKHASEPLFFVFPFAILDHQGQTIEVTDGQSLTRLLFECNTWPIIDTTIIHINAFSYLGCYELVFPFKVKVLGSNAPLTISDSEQFGNLLLQGRFEKFDFPIRLKAANGQIFTAENEQELDQLLNDCFTIGDLIFLLSGTELFSDAPCYDLIFPVSVKIQNQTSFLQSYQHIEQMLQDSLFFNYNINYPVSVKLKANKVTKTLLSLDDIFQTLIDCN